MLKNLMLIIFCIMCFLICKKDEESPDDESSKILFYSNRDGNWNLYTMEPDGSDVQKITIPINVVTQFADWRGPDTKIAFSSGDSISGPLDIYTVNGDGTALVNLTNTNILLEWKPKWSPDGDLLVYHYCDAADSDQVWVMNQDGTNKKQLSPDSIDARDPSWSPDGKRIVFCSWCNIYIMNADGSNVIKIAQLNSADQPDWSPDGDKIVFTGYNNGYEIFTINTDGSELKQLTSGGDNEGASWSPSGSKIIFCTHRDGDWEIYIMDKDGSNQHNITNNHESDEYPCCWRN